MDKYPRKKLITQMSQSHSNRRISKHQKTMDSILSFIKCIKSKEYEKIGDLLYDIRTNDLRAMLQNLGPNHLYYRSVHQILKNPLLESCYSEALYNLAVILSEKSNVPALVNGGLLESLMQFKNSEDPKILYNACWCLFGIAACDPEHREKCIENGVLELAVDLIRNSQNDSVRDISGQIIYGIFHMRPHPDKIMAKPFFDNIAELLKCPEIVLKYVLWSLHFATSDNPESLKDLHVEPALKNIISSQLPEVLIPLMVIISGLFKMTPDGLDDFLNELKYPLLSQDINVRVQTCRTTAEYIRNTSSVGNMLESGVYETLINIFQEDETIVKEQAVYAILRGFGLGSQNQKHQLANIGGLNVVLTFALEATPPFSYNLLDCLESLIMEDYDFFSNKLREINSVPTLYQLLSSNDQVLAGKAANIIGFVGDSYSGEGITS